MSAIVFGKNESEIKKLKKYITENCIEDYKFENCEINPDKIKKTNCIILANPTSFHNANMRMNLILLEKLYDEKGKFVCLEPSFEIKLNKPLDYQFASQFFIWYEYFNNFFKLNDVFNV